MIIGLLGLQVFANKIIGIFSVSFETQELCINAIRIITLGYFFVGANIAFQGIFQALGCGVRSLIVSLLRLIIVALPLAWIFSKISFNINLIWTAFPIAEAFALVVAIIFMKEIYNKKLKDI